MLYQEIETCFAAIEKHLTAQELLEIKHASQDDLYLCHFGIGMWIRNYLLLKDRKLYSMFVEEEIAHQDEMSFLIIKLFQQYLLQK